MELGVLLGTLTIERLFPFFSLYYYITVGKFQMSNERMRGQIGLPAVYPFPLGQLALGRKEIS